MPMVVNKSNRTLKMGGKTLPPSGMENVEVRDLQNHLFVKAGLIETAGGGKGGRGRPKKSEQVEEAPASESESGE